VASVREGGGGWGHLFGWSNRLVQRLRGNIEFRVPYSQRYLVLGLVGFVGLVGLGLPLLLRLG